MTFFWFLVQVHFFTYLSFASKLGHLPEFKIIVEGNKHALKLVNAA